MSLEMYQANIMDHNKHPRNFGMLSDDMHKAHAANPLCGDEIDFGLVFDANDRVADVKFSGRGCTITMASASILSEKLKGMSRSEVEKLSNQDILKFLAVPINPARLKCATLPLEAVQQAIGHH